MDDPPARTQVNRSPFLESRYGAMVAHARGLLIGGLVIAPIFALVATGFVAGLEKDPKIVATVAAALNLAIFIPLFIACTIPPEIDDARFRQGRIYVNIAVVAFLILVVGTIGLGIDVLWTQFDDATGGFDGSSPIPAPIEPLPAD